LCLSEKANDGSYIILLLYVDDMLVAGSNMQEINVLKRKLANSFEMKDLGAAKQILGMRITRDRKNISSHKILQPLHKKTRPTLYRCNRPLSKWNEDYMK